ncbi:serine/threonine-protein kinase [Piscinibacter sp. XHJ-5]|uniref:serine/threonine-protein kinase n=1 Tax=Piscinibacter sp. XHJ-5 TaxID=3037797 RepID=UPI002452BB0A|nr:serine/threonine-protein kinase [Piscinibacter sp. XHJ-5]
MSVSQALLQVMTGPPASTAGSLLGALIGLVLAAVHLFFVVSRLAPRPAGLASLLLAAVLLVASSALLVSGGPWWPTWPAALALLFGHLGLRIGRRAPQSTVAAAPKPAERPGAASAAAAAGPPTVPADRASLGRYRVDRQIGRGSMGAVYLGHDPKIGRQVAIKTMALSQEFDGAALTEARERFFREAETAGRLQHRDIVTIFDAGEEQDLAYIAMEFLKGHDLQRYTTAAQLLPVPTVLRIVARVADALAYAHSQGVVHRDIKPANVMIDPADGSVKVTDFGIARITDSSRTRTGMVLGTPSFMSPEQMAGRRVDGRSDLYSLGVMLFQLLTGRLPHTAESMAKLMYEIANEPAPDIRRMRADLPESLANVVALALKKRPEVRYADGRQLAADLRTIAAACAPAAGQSFPQADAAPPNSDGFAATVKLTRGDPGHNSPL